MLAKLHAYDFDRDSLKVLQSHLSNRHRRAKTDKDKSFNSWSKIVFEVPQGFLLGPFHFNIYRNDLFYMAELINMCNFEDDTTFHACNYNPKDLVNRLEHNADLSIEWFDYNYTKLI